MLVAFLISFFLSMQNQQDLSHNQNNSTTLVINADLVNCGNSPPIIKNNEVLLPMDIVKNYFDSNLFWDRRLQRAVITGRNKVIKMKLNSNSVLVNNKPVLCKMPAREIKGVNYIPIGFLKDIYGINIKINYDSNVVVIDSKQKKSKQGQVIDLVTFLRKSNFNSGPSIKNLYIGDEVEVFGTYKGWYKVRTKEGFTGFLETKSVHLVPITPLKYVVKKSSQKKVSPEKLILAWDQSLYAQGIKKIDGVQILSPSWFYISDSNGNVKSKAKLEYVKKAHESGYKVWALFTNCFSPIISKSVLNDQTLRDKVITQIVNYAKEYHVDGINIDFENMRDEDKDMFSQFVRELAPVLRAQGIIVSVDVGAPSGTANYWECYDPKALSEAVDYVALMTYDQHWSNCPYSGSVAQYSWVEDKLKATLCEVPANKLLLGIPFYTRGWKEELDNNGSTKTTQYSVFSMRAAKAEIKSNNAALKWDYESGQFYAQFKKDKATYKIWLEDDNSINLKSSLIQKYNLAGAAVWEKNYGTSSAWRVLKNSLQKNQNYEDWIKSNRELYSRLDTFYLSRR